PSVARRRWMCPNVFEVTKLVLKCGAHPPVIAKQARQPRKQQRTMRVHQLFESSLRPCRCTSRKRVRSPAGHGAMTIALLRVSVCSKGDRLIGKDYIEQRAVHFKAAVVLDESELSKAVHEEIHS